MNLSEINIREKDENSSWFGYNQSKNLKKHRNTVTNPKSWEILLIRNKS